MGRSSLAIVLAALVFPLCGCNTDASTPQGPIVSLRRNFPQEEPSLATTPDTSAEEGRRIWIAYNDGSEFDAIENGDPGFHNLDAISWSTDSGGNWTYESLPYASASTDPDLSFTGGDPWLASDGPTLVYTALGIRAGVTNAVALTESVDNQGFSPWRVIASAPDVAAEAAGGAGLATFDKPSVDLTTVPVVAGTMQVAAAATRLKRRLDVGQYPIRFDIALSVAVSSSPNESAADQSWTTRLLNVGSVFSMVTNPIVKISREGEGNLFVAYQRQPFDQAYPSVDSGARDWNIVRTTVAGDSYSPVFGASTTTNTRWNWTSGDTTRTMKDVVPMSFDVARRSDGTHLWITYPEKSDDGQHVVVADCDDTANHPCTPDGGWRYETIQGRNGGDVLQPSVVADQRGNSVSLIFYENRGDGLGLEPEGTVANLAADGSVTWTTPIPLTLDLHPNTASASGTSQDLSYVPCPYGTQYGDYIGSARLPVQNLTISAWSDSRRGCVAPGNDLHVQATLW